MVRPQDPLVPRARLLVMLEGDAHPTGDFIGGGPAGSYLERVEVISAQPKRRRPPDPGR